MTTDEVRELFCASCAEVVRFELLPRTSEVEASYDEWACTVCGAALFAGALVTLQTTAKTHRAA
ncbi:MAG: hypothetical protein ACRDT6_15775 [Micromonosporaceae bacterium]